MSTRSGAGARVLQHAADRLRRARRAVDRVVGENAFGHFKSGMQKANCKMKNWVNWGLKRNDEPFFISSFCIIKTCGRRRLCVAALSHEEVREVYAMRRLLEGAAAELAATRISDDGLAQLRRAADVLAANDRSLDWTARALRYDLEFHDAIAVACGNGRLRNDISRYRLLVRGLCRITSTLDNVHDALVEHVAIIEALEARNGRAARKAMATHIDARLACISGQHSSATTKS